MAETEDKKVEEVKAEEAPKAVEAVKEEKNPLERTLEISISREVMEREVARGLREKGRKARFHGFRPGKAPAAMVAAAFGPEVEYDVINRMVSEEYAKKASDEKLDVAGGLNIVPNDKAPKDDDQLHFTAYFEVFPEVEVPSLKDVEVVQYECALKDENVEKTLEVMRKQRSTYEKVDRAAEDTDRVTVDFKGTLNGEAFKGGTAENYPFVLGAGMMLPEFEKAVRGLKEGETKTFPLTFPEKYPSQELAGKEVSFEVTVKEVARNVLPELNDAFARSLGIMEGGVEKMKSDIRDNLQREVVARTEARTKQNVMDVLLSVAKFPVPHSTVENERQNMVRQALEDMRARGMKIDTSKIPDGVMQEEAERRVRLGLQMRAIIRKEDIKADDAQIKALAENIAKSYENPELVVEWYMNNPQRKSELESVAIENNVVDWVLKNAKVKKEPISFESLMGQQA